MLKIPTGRRLTSLLFTKRGVVEFGATKHKSIYWLGGRFDPGTCSMHVLMLLIKTVTDFQQPEEAGRKKVYGAALFFFFFFGRGEGGGGGGGGETLINIIIFNFQLAIQFGINCSAVSQSYASIYGNSFILRLKGPLARVRSVFFFQRLKNSFGFCFGATWGEERDCNRKKLFVSKMVGNGMDSHI